jgi:hypothetical protein
LVSVIVSGDFRYLIDWPSAPTSSPLRVTLDDVASGDKVLLRLVPLGGIAGLAINQTVGGVDQNMPMFGSLNALLQANVTGAFIDTSVPIGRRPVWLRFLCTTKTHAATLTW